MEQFIGTLVGAFLAVLVGFFVAVYHDIATEPVLEVVPNDEPPVTDRRLLEEMTDGDPLRPTGRLVRSPYRHQFLEIKVRQKNGLWPFPTRRPAWRCRVTFDVFRHDGSRAIAERITARWSGSLQPYRTQLVDGRLRPIPDDSLVPLGQTFDVHANAEEKVGVALKYEGFDECWIFSNESYQQRRAWEKPEWKLDMGDYYIAVKLHYQSSLSENRRTWWIRLRNGGKSFDDWSITFVSRPPFSSDKV